MNQVAERIESLKAGSVGATVGIALFLAEVSGAAWLVPELAIQHGGGFNQLYSLFQAGVVGFSGFLFGVTYRYIMRNDQNPHLKAGAVGAFGLVRGLAVVSITLAAEAYWLSALRLLESLLLFAVAASLLDWLMQQGWIKSFREF